VISTNLPITSYVLDSSSVSAEEWAKKYLQQLDEQDSATNLKNQDEPKEIAQRLLQELRPMSLQGWKDTESLLSGEMIRHQIDAKLIDPWEISKDAHNFFEKALQAFANQIALPKLAVQLADDIGTVRHKYTATDPRVIGFISMQFFYTGQNLLNLVSVEQRSQVGSYFNVISDHLYMPLKRAFNAAGKHASKSPDLQIVRKLLPVNTEIAHRIVTKTLETQSAYRCHTGLLGDPAIQISSIRDIEMVQIYLWVCILEGNFSSIQEELFPLCVMLYPRLRVSWELVRQMIFLIGQAFQTHLAPEQMRTIRPYYQGLWDMFSPEVFPDVVND
jgi:hypothetical protein